MNDNEYKIVSDMMKRMSRRRLTDNQVGQIGNIVSSLRTLRNVRATHELVESQVSRALPEEDNSSSATNQPVELSSLLKSVANQQIRGNLAGSTLAEQHIWTLNERFATAAEELGEDKPPAVRLAGVYAMASLADDWEGNRQTCIDVLCAYLRLPYSREPGSREKAQQAFQADREVRHTVIRVITEHLREPQGRPNRKVAWGTKAAKQVAPVSWQGWNFNFSGVVFDGGTFSDAYFSGGTVEFSGAEFRGNVNFRYANFSGGEVHFHRARFSGGTVEFHDAQFSGGLVDFKRAEFSGGMVSFDGAEFSGALVSFEGAEFSAGTVDFSHAADWSHPPKFDWEGAPTDWVKLPAAAASESQ